jgi:DNA topoisomerase-1
VRDLVPKEGAVDDKHFAMNYQSIERNEKHVDAISRALKKSKNLYLATDPDREGEAISWHLRELLEERGDLKGKEVKRVVFYEITKGEVQRAVSEPRDLSLDLVNAQQARRALDYLVGFNLSPLLWKKVRRGLSAGRVQSPALRMICEREHEISIFKPQEYWTLECEGEHSTQTFPLKLVEFEGKKVEQFSFTSEAAARGVEHSIKDAAQGFLHVISIDRKQRRRNPSPPFTTSTLQQEAARKLGSPPRTMRLAQRCTASTSAASVSSPTRTDSVNLAATVREMREVIVNEYGKEAVSEECASTRRNRAMHRKPTRPFDRRLRPSCRRASR